MALISTPGGSNSNVLCSLAEADAYIAASLYPDKATWPEKDETERESLLILAGLAMNDMNWIGWKVYREQAMCWPRWMWPKAPPAGRSRKRVTGAFPSDVQYGDPYWRLDDEDFVEATAVFPQNVQKAFAYFAYDVTDRMLQGRTSPAAGPATDAIKSLSLFGDLSMSFSPEADLSLLDMTNLSALLRGRHYEIYQLLQAYVADGSSYGNERFEPTLLDEITATT